MPVDIHPLLVEIFRERQQQITHVQAVSGGSINQSFKITTTGGTYFCKTNGSARFPLMFEKEKNGIESIAATATINVPGNVITGQTAQEQWIIMDWVQEKPAAAPFWKNFAAALAALHHQVQQSFGFREDNYMGALHQSNAFHQGWVDFFREERLQPQVKLARDKGFLPATAGNGFERLYQRLPQLFTDEQPCLVHGDLWSGNFICDVNGQAVLIDPAVYYGNRHVDLAMTTLFGGFDDVFYQAYAYHFPLPANYREQWRIINLYPLLVHLNLFGKSYLSSILGTIAAY